MINDPKVTVIITTYKRSSILKRSIDSVLSQSYEDFELIIVDDNQPDSPDRESTEKMVSQYNSDKIIYIKHEVNRNGSAARNTGIMKAKGEFIAFLDDDDEFLPDRLIECVQKMNTLDETWAGCYTGYKKILKNNKYQISNEKKEGAFPVHALARNFFIGAGSNLFIRRSAAAELGGFDESFVRNQDYEFLVRLFLKYKLAYIDKCLLVIHYEIRDYKLSYENCIETEKKFLKTFEPVIENLTEKERYYIYTNMALQRFRVSIYKREVKDGIKNLFINKVGFHVVMHYVFHIIHRVFTRKSCSFNMRI